MLSLVLDLDASSRKLALSFGLGQKPRTKTITARSTPSHDPSELTPRELDVLALMAEGASNKTIARRLGISVHTAKFHVGSILEKLDATGRTDAVLHAARRSA